MAGISVGTTTTSSVQVYISGLDTSWSNGQRTVYWYLGSAGGGIPTASKYSQMKTTSLANGISEGGYITFSDLSANTQYGVYCAIYYGSTLLAGLQGYVKTNAQSGGGSTGTTWTVLTATVYSNLVNANVSELLYSQPYRVYRIAVTFAMSGYVKFFTRESGNGFDPCGVLTDAAATWDNATEKPIGGNLYIENDDGPNSPELLITHYVTAGETYYLWVRDINGSQGITELVIVTMDSSWHWDSSNGSATDQQTKDAYTAITSKGNTKNFSYKVWNDMVDKVKAMIDSNNLFYWDSGYANYANTRMSESDKELTAIRFNSLRNNLELVGKTANVNIGQIPNSSIPHPVYTGDKVYGNYFITLADYMNRCIEKL